jgi:hypothetical protein
MPDTSSAGFRRRGRPESPADTSGQLMVSGIEPVDGTWFETFDAAPADEPLLVLVPVRASPPSRN